MSGATIDLLRGPGVTQVIKANAETANPSVLVDPMQPGGWQSVTGGNFHAKPVAIHSDQIAALRPAIGAVVQRRVALMVEPTLYINPPPVPRPELNSGPMITEATATTPVSENKIH